MLKGKTTNGFEFEIADEAFNDMRVMDALMELDEAEAEDAAKAIFGMSKVATLLLGKKQKEKMYAFIEKEHGKVNMDVFVEMMGEILSSQGKN